MRMCMEEIERRLKAAGAAAAETPSDTLMQRTMELATHALISHCSQARQMRRWLIRVLALMAFALPIPVLFLWIDWNIARSVLGAILPGEASIAASAIYLWMKISLVGFLYAALVPLLVWLAISVRVSRRTYSMIPEAELSYE
jgi:hypothetical protein